jgi:alpha-amylase/alpha-mannosidase (GH57 family)
MASQTPIALVFHGHFYQPPRENPWTDEVSREPSALPYHDWNERILSECYRANAFARVYGAGGRLQTLVNNYSHLSFNVGPTLARWIDKVDSARRATVAPRSAGGSTISSAGSGARPRASGCPRPRPIPPPWSR